jgi:hypothetical protein
MDVFLGLVTVGGFILFLLLLVFCSYQLRRWKYKQIANELGAEYQSQGYSKRAKSLGPAIIENSQLKT